MFLKGRGPDSPISRAIRNPFLMAFFLINGQPTPSSAGLCCGGRTVCGLSIRSCLPLEY